MDYETPQFFRVMQYAASADRDVVDMVSGNPDWAPPDALREGLRSYADGAPPEFQYAPSAGLRELREAIAERRGVDVDRVVITNGAAEANHLAMACGLATMPGSEVLLMDPLYPYYAGRANLLDADLGLVPVDESGHADPAAVRSAASQDTAVIVVNTPNNPLGVTYDRDTVAAIASIADDVGALLVSDEVYDHFDYSGRFASALSVAGDNRVVTNSVSKSLAITGWRVGYGVFPPQSASGPAADIGDRARTRHMLSTISASRPAQAAVLHALRETEPAYFERVRDRLRARIETFTAALETIGATYTDPEGAFYVVARFADMPGTFANVERLIDEAGVAGMPGEAFGRSRADWIRFSLTTDRVETAADRLVSYFSD